MLRDLTFNEVCKQLKTTRNATVVEAVDRLVGAAILISPAFGTDAALAANLLQVKGEIANLATSVLNAIASTKDTDYVARMKKMEAAYGWICFTAAFEAIDDLMPTALRRDLSLAPSEKRHLAATSATTSTGAPVASQRPRPQQNVLEQFVSFPHPADSYEQQVAWLHRFYQDVARNFRRFVAGLAVWQDADEELRARIEYAVERLPARAMECFEAQYLELARRFHDFYVWSQLHEHELTRNELADVSSYIYQYTQLVEHGKKEIDVGFDRLRDTVHAMPRRMREVEAASIVEAIRLHNEARVREPIVQDDSGVTEDPTSLTFPSISDAFVPQSFAVIRAHGPDTSPEREDSWHGLKRQDGVGAFLLNYLSSPYSVDTPLLIVGHPGSGKSTLAKVFCANAMSQSYTPIRVPLRDVLDADTPIESIVEEHISSITGHRLTSWANFSAQFAENPLVIVLDGYDELLQASGRVFAGYLKAIQHFQQREAEQGRPIRVIVTSRIALIGKASLPRGSTIIRLLEFSPEQRAAWSTIWNAANGNYFEACDPPIEPFDVPTDRRIVALAEQPLLLLLLALYDSDGNRLREHRALDRVLLYDGLLRQFVKREKLKTPAFDHLDSATQETAIDQDMRRLGVAAIGMYNRKKLHALASELESDLAFFDLAESIPVAYGRPMTQSDMLLGSFFFIHVSQGASGQVAGLEPDTAFEFLHNTFGEFLTAHFIVESIVHETEVLTVYRRTTQLHAEHARKLTSANGFGDAWLSCFIYTTLTSRPVVLEMVREWIAHVLRGHERPHAEFIAALDEIVQSQVRMALNGRELPSLITTDRATQFGDMPAFAHVATYTLNLVILRTTLDQDDYLFDEKDYSVSDETLAAAEVRPWDRLTGIWRAWFPVDSLEEVIPTMTAERLGSVVRLTRNRGDAPSTYRDRLGLIRDVANVLGDSVTAGLATLLSSDTHYNRLRRVDEVDDASKSLMLEGINVELEAATRVLRWELVASSLTESGLAKWINTGIDSVAKSRARPDLVGEFTDLLTRYRRSGRLTKRIQEDAATRLSNNSAHDRVSREQELASILQLNRLARVLGAGAEMRRLSLEHLGDDWVAEAVKNHPDDVIEWFATLRDMSTEGSVEQDVSAALRTFDSAILEIAVDEFIEVRPDVVLEWYLIGRGIDELWAPLEVGRQYFARVTERKTFATILSERPRTAVKWLTVAHELGGYRWIVREGVELFRSALEMVDDASMEDVLVGVAIDWVNAARGVGNDEWIERFREMILQQVDAEAERLGTIEPTAVFRMLRLWRVVRELQHDDAERVARSPFEETAVAVLRSSLNGSVFVGIVNRQPEVAIEMLRLARSTDESLWASLLADDSCREAIIRVLPRLSHGDVGTVANWATELQDRSMLRAVRMQETGAPRGVRGMTRAVPAVQRGAHVQIADDLEKRIMEGELREGDVIPSERMIAADWGVSRDTATQAIARLISKGLVRSVVGVGTLVAKVR